MQVLLELFSGIGGFAKGFAEAGWSFDKHYYSEIDSHAIANYKHNFPHAESIGAVEYVFKRDIQRPTIITFGSPCQDFSLAGKREGLKGQRSSLISHAIGLVGKFRPDFFIWENVKGAFSSNDGADFWALIRAFADIGGYRCEWQLLNTSWFLPQNRERIYLIGHLAEPRRSFKGIFPIIESNQRYIEAGGEQAGQFRNKNTQTATALKQRDYKGVNNFVEYPIIQKTRNDCTTFKKDITGTLQGGGANVMDKVPNIVLQENPKILQQNMEGKVFEKDEAGTLRGGASANYQTVFLSEPTHKHGEERTYTDIAPTIQSRYGTGGDNVPYVNYPKKHQQDKINEVDTDSKTLVVGSHGNADDHTKTNINGTIRRLTEIECERLQGYPDEWTKYGIYEKKAWINKKEKTFEIVEGVHLIPKTQRYKLCGNAVSVPVIKAIAEKLKQE